MRYDHFEMLPERAFQKKLFGYSPATLEGGKGGGSAPAADPNIAKAQMRMADLAEQQYTDFKTNIWPELQKQTQSQLERSNKLADQQFETTQKQNAIADEAYARYKEKGIPLQNQIFDQANAAGGAGDQEKQSALALGDVSQQFANRQQANERSMQAYGINPNSGAYQGQNNANQIMQAATGASAATRARDAAIQLGWSKKMDAAALAQGQFSNQASSTAMGLNAGASSLASGAAGGAALGALGNSYSQGTAGAMQGYNNVGQLGTSVYNTQMQGYNADQNRAAQSSAGFGSAVGGLIGAGMSGGSGGFANSAIGMLAMSDVRAKENIKLVGWTHAGLPVYDYEYKLEFKNNELAGHGIYRGYMAHEVEKMYPDAVSVGEHGYKVVDYSKVV